MPRIIDGTDVITGVIQNLGLRAIARNVRPGQLGWQVGETGTASVYNLRGNLLVAMNPSEYHPGPCRTTLVFSKEISKDVKAALVEARKKYPSKQP